MARKPRAEHAPGIYHVSARGNDRQLIYRTPDDRRSYLVLLGKITALRRWRTMAYCLMDNHVHLLIETVAPNLGAGMQRLHGSYAQAYNRRHGRSGHLLEGRYHAVPIEDDAQLQMVARYIALNPVAAGLCATPEEWAWGSHAAAMGLARRPAWLDVARLLEFFAGSGGEPRERYARLVADGREARGEMPGPLDESARERERGQPPTPFGDWERIHSRSVSSPTRA